jgi:RNA polymerase sigma-B factor
MAERTALDGPAARGDSWPRGPYGPYRSRPELDRHRSPGVAGQPADQSRADARRLFVTLAALPPGSAERARLRNQLVEMHLPLAHYYARRYAGRGEPLDDLRQAGALGLVYAVDRFDPDRGVEFSSFAVPTIVGEIRRHFRDRTWAMHVNRDMQELTAQIGRCSGELTQKLARSPSIGEIARSLAQPDDRVTEALGCAAAYRPGSLNSPAGEDRTVGDTVGSDDPAFGSVEMHLSLGPALAKLSDRERRILQLRFYADQTQSQISGQLGISQMHVSRLLARALGRLRTELA